MIERAYKVTGMHCESCVELVTEDVAAIDGVESVEVDLTSGRALVRVDPDRVSDAAVVAAIRDAGYDAVPA